MANRLHLSIDKGSDFSKSISVLVNGVGQNLTSYTATSKFRKEYTSNTSYSFTTDVNPDGIVNLYLSANTSANIADGTYVYDCVITSPTGIVTRISEGMVYVKPSVTR